MPTFDKIGYWSEIELDIIREYASAYSKILTSKGLYHLYIDAFAGAGQHVSTRTGAIKPGSPLNALSAEPPFQEYHFIELNSRKASSLREITAGYPDVLVYEGDCNKILVEKIFPKARWEDFRRALVLLDPYGLHLNWKVIETAGRMRSVELFLNFPVGMDMNRNVLWHSPDKVPPRAIARLNTYWGDESWRNIAYTTQSSFLGEPSEIKGTNADIVHGFRNRLQDVAGFKHVPDPIPMRNEQGAVIYYLFFAAQQPVAENIVRQIFEKYRNRGLH